METLYERKPQTPGRKLDIRERIEDSGSPGIADHELLAAIIGSGTSQKSVRELAEELLEKLDLGKSIPSVADVTSIRGFGKASACRLIAALELGRRLYGVREHRITSPREAWYSIRHFGDRKQEHFITCTLNGAHDLINVHIVTKGLVNRTIVHPREVFACALEDRACAVILAHNHPSGRLEPSQEDIDITQRLLEAGNLLGIKVLDHLIFSEDAYTSLVESGHMNPDSTE